MIVYIHIIRNVSVNKHGGDCQTCDPSPGGEESGDPMQASLHSDNLLPEGKWLTSKQRKRHEAQ